MIPALNASVLGALRCFEAAARHLNFTRAGEELHLTTGAVSQQIRQLEDRLGCPLFNRLGRGVSLTPEGLQLHAAVVSAFEQLRGAIAGLGKSEGSLSLSCSPSFALLWLLPRLPAFRNQHPDIEVKVIAEFQSVDRNSLAVGNIHAAIRYDPAPYVGVDEITLMDEYLLPVATAKYVNDHLGSLPHDDLGDATLLHDASPWDGAEVDTEWKAWATKKGVSLASCKSQEFNLFMLALSAARNHHGICMGRAALVLDELRDGTLVAFTGGLEYADASYKLITTRASDPRIKALIGWLQEECANTEALRDQYFGLGHHSL